MAQSCGAARWDKMDKRHILLDIFPEMALFRKKQRAKPWFDPCPSPHHHSKHFLFSRACQNFKNFEARVQKLNGIAIRYCCRLKPSLAICGGGFCIPQGHCCFFQKLGLPFPYPKIANTYP